MQNGACRKAKRYRSKRVSFAKIKCCSIRRSKVAKSSSKPPDYFYVSVCSRCSKVEESLPYARKNHQEPQVGGSRADRTHTRPSQPWLCRGRTGNGVHAEWHEPVGQRWVGKDLSKIRDCRLGRRNCSAYLAARRSGRIFEASRGYQLAETPPPCHTMLDHPPKYSTT